MRTINIVKRMATLSAALVMAATVAAPATMITGMAAGTSTITVQTDDVHTYVSYQILTGDFTTEGDSKILANAAFGADVNSANLITALGLDASSTAQAVADKLSTMTADAIATTLKTEGVLTTGTTLNKGVNNVDEGYYYISETNNKVTGSLLKVADDGGVTIKAKVTDTASVEKKVWEEEEGGVTVLGSGWQDTADAEFNESVSFKLTATIPTNLSAYEHFYFRLDDTLSEGLTITADSYEYYRITKDGEGDPVYKKINSGITASGITNNADGTQSISFTCNDVKALLDEDGNAVLGGEQIVVVYKATLDEGFVVTPTTGNDNAVTLTYSNNPESTYDGTGYGEDEDTPGENSDLTETDKDEVRVLTYAIDITKVNAADHATLAGAKFKLYREDGKYAKIGTNGKITGWVEEADATELTTNAAGKLTLNGTDAITISGVDDDTYYLKETKAPDGFNDVTTPFTVEIASTLTTTVDAWAADTNPIETLSVNGSGNYTTGTVTIDIENTKGSSLPETGGMGTTLFYFAGGALVIGSGVALIAKKRMKNKDM
ncbi:MAG: SpaA isopeptide-forming pilin-related protein [Hominimerdicola sp.]